MAWAISRGPPQTPIHMGRGSGLSAAAIIALDKELPYFTNPSFVKIPVYTSAIGGIMISISAFAMILKKLKDRK